jgi:hypothetical protein
MGPSPESSKDCFTKSTTEAAEPAQDISPYDGDEGREIIDDELLWVPQTASVSFRPLCFCVSAGYYVNLLRVRGAGLLSRHRHPGPVHGHVLKGSWKYLEHKWTATAGSYSYEPPGEIHTLVVPDGVEEMVRSRRYRRYSFLSSITIKPCQLLEQCWSLSYCSRRPTSPRCHFVLVRSVLIHVCMDVLSASVRLLPPIAHHDRLPCSVDKSLRRILHTFPRADYSVSCDLRLIFCALNLDGIRPMKILSTKSKNIYDPRFRWSYLSPFPTRRMKIITRILLALSPKSMQSSNSL